MQEFIGHDTWSLFVKYLYQLQAIYSVLVDPVIYETFYFAGAIFCWITVLQSTTGLSQIQYVIQDQPLLDSQSDYVWHLSQ